MNEKTFEAKQPEGKADAGPFDLVRPNPPTNWQTTWWNETEYVPEITTRMLIQNADTYAGFMKDYYLRDLYEKK